MNEAVGFEIEEAEVLDDQRFEEWLGMLTEDMTYEMPVRVTRERAAGSGLTEKKHFFYDDKLSLEMRVKRLATEYAWAEDPPSRTRHFLTNIRVAPGASKDQLSVKSNVLLYRSRLDESGHEILSYERHDVLRSVDNHWKLAKRRIIVDQAVLGVRNLSIFL